MLEKVRKILAEQLRISEKEITGESKIKEDLGADSLDILQLLFTIEEMYGVQVPDEKLATFATVNDVVAFLEELEKK